MKGSATSRVNAAAVGKPAVNAVGKASGTVPGGKTSAAVPPKPVPSKNNRSAPAPTGAPEELTEPAPTPVETVPPVGPSSYICLLLFILPLAWKVYLFQANSVFLFSGYFGSLFYIGATVA